MNPQKLFENIIKHQRKQGRQCTTEVGLCVYRYDDKGLKSAIGSVMPDDLYNENIEGLTIKAVYNAFLEIQEYFGQDNLALLILMQEVHDHKKYSDWEKWWKHIAEQFKLEYKRDNINGNKS